MFFYKSTVSLPVILLNSLRQWSIEEPCAVASNRLVVNKLSEKRCGQLVLLSRFWPSIKLVSHNNSGYFHIYLSLSFDPFIIILLLLLLMSERDTIRGNTIDNQELGICNVWTYLCHAVLGSSCLCVSLVKTLSTTSLNKAFCLSTFTSFICFCLELGTVSDMIWLLWNLAGLTNLLAN